MDMKRILNAAGATLGRIIQQAEEAFLDIPRTEYSAQYKENIKKVDFLIILTEKLITDFERFLEINAASSGEVKLMDNVMEPDDRFTYLEEFGVILQNPLEEIKLYSPLLDKNLLKVGKYQIKLGETFKAYIKSAGEIYIKKLRKMLEIDLKQFKDEEANLENLRLDHDYLRNRMDNAYTQLGREALVKDYERVKSNFEFYLEKTTELFKTVDSYFTTHRILLKEFVEIQRNYYRDCDKYLTTLLRKMYTGYEGNYLFEIYNAYRMKNRFKAQSEPIVVDSRRKKTCRKPPCTHNANNIDIKPDLISTECKVNSAAFENDAHGKVNLKLNTEISHEEPKSLSTVDGEIETPQILTSENTAIQINDENTIETDFNSQLSCKIESNEINVKTNTSEVSLNSSIDFNNQNNGNLENGGDFKESVETEPAMVSVSTNLENLIPDSSDLNIDMNSDLNFDVHTELDPKPSDDLIQPVINTSLENTTPELSINIQNDLDIKFEEKISDEPLTIDTVLQSNISEPALTLNITSMDTGQLDDKLPEYSIQPEVNLNLEVTSTDLSMNIPTDSILNENLNINETEKIESDISVESMKSDMNLKIETSLQDTLEIKNDTNQPQPDKLEADISLGSITSDADIRVANNSLVNIQTPSTEETNVIQEDVSLVETPNIDINQDKEDRTSNLAININSEIDVKAGLVEKERQISDENSSLDKIKTDLTEPIEIFESIKDIKDVLDTNINIEPEKVETLNSLNLKTEIDINPDMSIGESVKLEEIPKNENDQNINANIITESPAQLDSHLEIKEPEKELSETPKETKIITESPAQLDSQLEIKDPEKELSETPKETNIITESPAQLDPQLEIKEPEKEISETPKETNIITESPAQLDPQLEIKEPEKEISETPKEINIITESPAQLDPQHEIKEPEKEISETPKEINIITESPAQLDSQIEFKEPEKEISETPKETNEIPDSPAQLDSQLEIKESEKEISETPKETSIITESPAQLDSQLEIKEPEKEISETPKENENNEKIEMKFNDEEKTDTESTLKPDQTETESDKTINPEEK